MAITKSYIDCGPYNGGLAYKQVKRQRCYNCRYGEGIEGRDEMTGCKHDNKLHNAEGSCINWLPVEN